MVAPNNKKPTTIRTHTRSTGAQFLGSQASGAIAST